MVGFASVPSIHLPPRRAGSNPMDWISSRGHLVTFPSVQRVNALRSFTVAVSKIFGCCVLESDLVACHLEQHQLPCFWRNWHSNSTTLLGSLSSAWRANQQTKLPRRHHALPTRHLRYRLSQNLPEFHLPRLNHFTSGMSSSSVASCSWSDSTSVSYTSCVWPAHAWLQAARSIRGWYGATEAPRACLKPSACWRLPCSRPGPLPPIESLSKYTVRSRMLSSHACVLPHPKRQKLRPSVRVIYQTVRKP